jgi:hypothetical protein
MGLSSEQIEAIRAQAEKYKRAVAKASEAQVTLWQTRIDMAITMGEFSFADLISPVAWNDNCNCAATPIAAEEVMRGWRK